MWRPAKPAPTITISKSFVVMKATLPATDDLAREPRHQLMRVATEHDSEVGDPCPRELAQPLEALVRRPGDGDRADRVRVEQVEVLLPEPQEIVFVEPREVAVGIDLFL